ncbi:MAG: hypothetical protein ACXV5P_10065, partial [Halobacteriota archaeon]
MSSGQRHVYQGETDFKGTALDLRRKTAMSCLRRRQYDLRLYQAEINWIFCTLLLLMFWFVRTAFLRFFVSPTICENRGGCKARGVIKMIG